MKNWKLILIAVSLLLVAIIVFQNTGEVTTKLLFAKVVVPQAVLLIGTFAIGFAVGVLYTLRRRQSTAKVSAPS